MGLYEHTVMTFSVRACVIYCMRNCTDCLLYMVMHVIEYVSPACAQARCCQVSCRTAGDYIMTICGTCELYVFFVFVPVSVYAISLSFLPPIWRSVLIIKRCQRRKNWRWPVLPARRIHEWPTLTRKIDAQNVYTKTSSGERQ